MTQKNLTVDGKDYIYYSLEEAAKSLGDISRLPSCLKILLENSLRFGEADLTAFKDWFKNRTSTHEILFRPARVLMQDFTGVPAIVDLAAMRAAVAVKGGDPASVNPHIPVDLVIDHSVTVDHFATAEAFGYNVEQEVTRNHERYAFLKWGQQAFQNFRVVPPGTGICHQVNLEYLAQVVWTNERNEVYPDTVIGLDSHTPMVNGLGVLGWGVGGIEAEAAMLGQPSSMILPDVVGLRLEGQLQEGVTATDLVLTVTQMLRAHGVVGKFVEVYGPGLRHLTIADRATISNMAPEYGATCALFPIDEETLSYLRFTGRDPHRIKLVEAYAKVQGLWEGGDPLCTETLVLNLGDVEPSVAGPKRPQDKVLLKHVAASCQLDPKERVGVPGTSYTIGNGDVVIAAITSCTNTSNPAVMIAAGLVARKALAKGLKCKPWVKTSLAPGSQVVSDYFEKADLQKDLDALGFYLVGYGCTTCIGNSGPLPEPIAKTLDEHSLSVAAVLSGNRNFEGRIHPQVTLSYLASPPLVVAYALAGTMLIDLTKDPLGQDTQGHDVFLKDIWPTTQEVQALIKTALTPQMFTKRYAAVFEGDQEWADLEVTPGLDYKWPESTYIKCPSFCDRPVGVVPLKGARPLAILGDSITTDHISPAGSIKKESPAGRYLLDQGVEERNFNSYGSRRGNYEVMMRGTFANIRLHNEMIPGVTGGVTRYMPGGEVCSIYEAAMAYQKDGVPLVIIAGKEYGSGSSRDWAAKGPLLLGVRAVIAETFERIHRSNLVGMGILPLTFTKGMTRNSLGFEGTETIDIDLGTNIKPGMEVTAHITHSNGRQESIPLLCQIQTDLEITYYSQGGVLAYMVGRTIA